MVFQIFILKFQPPDGFFLAPSRRRTQSETITTGTGGTFVPDVPTQHLIDLPAGGSSNASSVESDPEDKTEISATVMSKNTAKMEKDHEKTRKGLEPPRAKRLSKPERSTTSSYNAVQLSAVMPQHLPNSKKFHVSNKSINYIKISKEQQL